MLITGIVYINNKEFIHNYSDDGHYIIRNDGKKFVDALDLSSSEWTYTESEEFIPQEPDE